MDAIMTGSFDPITLGHIEIIKKASKCFEHFYVVALLNTEKNYLFTPEEKKELMELSLSDIDNVIVDTYDGFTADYMHQRSICKIIRGIRNEQDLEYEKKISNAMKAYDPDFDTFFIYSSPEYKHISSSLVKEKLNEKEDISSFVSPNAVDRILEIYNSKVQ